MFRHSYLSLLPYDVFRDLLLILEPQDLELLHTAYNFKISNKVLRLLAERHNLPYATSLHVLVTCSKMDTKQRMKIAVKFGDVDSVKRLLPLAQVNLSWIPVGCTDMIRLVFFDIVNRKEKLSSEDFLYLLSTQDANLLDEILSLVPGTPDSFSGIECRKEIQMTCKNLPVLKVITDHGYNLLFYVLQANLVSYHASNKEIIKYALIKGGKYDRPDVSSEVDDEIINLLIESGHVVCILFISININSTVHLSKLVSRYGKNYLLKIAKNFQSGAANIIIPMLSSLT